MSERICRYKHHIQTLDKWTRYTDKFRTNNAGDSANNEFIAHESMNITVKVKIVESPVVLVDIQGKVYGVLQIDRPSPFCPIS